MNYSYNLKQLLPLATVFFLSPALRLVPSGTAELAGRAAWVSVAVALPMLILYMYFISRFLRRRLRSRFVTVSELAERYHGGGHACAAGATVYSKSELKALLKEADALLKNYKENNGGWL